MGGVQESFLKEEVQEDPEGEQTSAGGGGSIPG